MNIKNLDEIIYIMENNNGYKILSIDTLKAKNTNVKELIQNLSLNDPNILYFTDSRGTIFIGKFDGDGEITSCIILDRKYYNIDFDNGYITINKSIWMTDRFDLHDPIKTVQQELDEYTKDLENPENQPQTPAGYKMLEYGYLKPQDFPLDNPLRNKYPKLFRDQ